MNYEKIVTLYDTAEHAEAARLGLEAAGFPPSDMSMVSKMTLGLTGQTLLEPGLWHRLFGRDIEPHEATVYGRVVESGGVVLTIRVPESEAARAMANSERSWRCGCALTGGAAGVDLHRNVGGTLPFLTGRFIRLAEEHLDVGKRLVEEGTTRIRRFVTEKPVEAQVTLHEEHAKVVRRAIADPAFVKDIDWTDKTIEVTETAEEAVITKNARITEESGRLEGRERSRGDSG